MTRLECAKTAWSIIDAHIREHPDQISPIDATEIGLFMAEVIKHEERYGAMKDAAEKHESDVSVIESTSKDGRLLTCAVFARGKSALKLSKYAKNL